jgi:YVTN family beta-propeller protein
MKCLLLIPVLLVMAGAGNTSAHDAAGILLVANKGDQSIGIVDPGAGTQVAVVAEGGTTGHEVVASPDGRMAYVPIYGNSGVGKPGTDGSNMVVIDIAARKAVGNLDFGRGVRPHCPIFGPKDGMLYVTTELEKAIAVIDPKTLKIMGSIPTGQPESHMLAISRDGRRGYTANVGPGTVSVLDMEHRKVITVIPVAKTVQRIAVSPDGSMAFTSDQTQPRLAVIDTHTNQVKSWIALPGLGYGAAATPDGKWLVIAISPANKVAVVDFQAMKVAHTIEVPAAPQEVVIQPDGQMAYVSCDASRKIAAIRVSDWSVQRLIEAGAGVDGMAWAGR